MSPRPWQRRVPANRLDADQALVIQRTADSLAFPESPANPGRCPFCQEIPFGLLQEFKLGSQESWTRDRFYVETRFCRRTCDVCKAITSLVENSAGHKLQQVRQSKIRYEILARSGVNTFPEFRISLRAVKTSHSKTPFWVLLRRRAVDRDKDNDRVKRLRASYNLGLPFDKSINAGRISLRSRFLQSLLDAEDSSQDAFPLDDQEHKEWCDFFDHMHTESLDVVHTFRPYHKDPKHALTLMPGDLRAMERGVNYDLLRFWEQMCDSSGRECRGRHIITNDAMKFSDVRLVDLERGCLVDATLQSSYIALSYVWGQKESAGLMLMKRNLDHFYERGSLFSTMPLSIWDAAEVARQLNYRYLFVDRLCIIQDDEDDKVYYVDKMDLVFGFASMTIVAAAGNSASAGLPGVCSTLRKLDSRSFLNADFGPEASDSVWLADAPKLRPETMLYDALAKSTWISRGWTFQEALMSSRMLVFTDKKVFWSCPHRQCTEDVALEEVNLRQTTSLAGQSLDHEEPLENLPMNSRPYAKSKKFCSLVTSYTRRELSFPGDRLRAFQGIISAYADANIPWSFHHGMSTTMFPVELTWGVLPEDDAIHRKDPNHASPSRSSVMDDQFPSYSWLCVQDEILWDHDAHDPALSILSSPLALTTSFYRIGHENKLISIWSETRPLAMKGERDNDRNWYAKLGEQARLVIAARKEEMAIIFGAYQRKCTLSFVRAGEDRLHKIYIELEDDMTLHEYVGWQQRPAPTYAGKTLGIVVLGETKHPSYRRTRTECILVEWRDGLAYRIGKFTTRDFTEPGTWLGFTFDLVILC